MLFLCVCSRLDRSPIYFSHHTHVHFFHVAYLIAATPEELGLTDPRFLSKSICESKTTAGAGFTGNAEMLNHVIATCPRCFSLTAPDSRLLCRANASFATVPGFARGLNGTLSYDRGEVLTCTNGTMPFRQGEIFTSLSFFGPRDLAAEWFPNPSMGRPEGMYPEHTNWRMYYVAERGVNERQLSLDVTGEILSVSNRTCDGPPQSRDRSAMHMT